MGIQETYCHHHLPTRRGGGKTVASLKPTAKSPAPGQMLLSVPEAATQLGIGRSKLYELIGEGRLQVVHIGRRTLITAESVRHFTQPGPAT